DLKIERDKFRSIDGYYRLNGLKIKDLQNAIMATNIKMRLIKQRQQENKELNDKRWETVHGFVGKIRPCFQVRMDKGEMEHGQRRALLVEAFYAGYDTEEKMLELFKCFHDYNENISRYQIHYWFERPKPKPYTCKKILESGWCLKDDCPIYQKRMERLKNGN
ncbi:MAG: hypothetical protein ACUVT3_13125, partial [Ignavibacterium sp.]